MHGEAFELPARSRYRGDWGRAAIRLAIAAIARNDKPKIVSEDLAMRKGTSVRSKKALSEPRKTPSENKSRA